MGDLSQHRIVIQGGVRGFLTTAGFDFLSAWKDAVNKVMNTAAEAQRNATARHTNVCLRAWIFAARRSFDDTILRGEKIDWVQLTESQGNRFRLDLPKYLFLGQEFITKEARGCMHFDLAKASVDIEDTSIQIMQILPQDMVETVLNTEGLRACAKEIN